jgi:hypothetical protein
MRSLPVLSSLALVLGILCLALGCADEPSGQPTTRSDDALLRDPFNYKPFANDPDISGGSIGHYDKNAMHKDLKDVFDP